MKAYFKNYNISMTTDVLRRLDVFESELGSVKRTDEGFAHFFARATRTGVFLYRNSDGSIRRELRLPEEVFKKESMDSLQNKPITNDHPFQLVDSKNSRDYTVGMTGNEVVQDNIFLKTKAIITDEGTINDIVQKGKVEVSCGYTCEHEVKPGTFDGEKFDVIQRNIKYNHLAVVDAGRAGPEVKLRLDSKDAIMVNEIDGKLILDEKHKKEENMPKITIDGIEQDVSEEFKAAFDKKNSDIESEMEKKKKKEELELDKEVKKKDSLLSKVQAELDSLKEKVSKEDAAEKKAKADSAINERVKSRLSLYDAAKSRCEEEVVSKLDSMSDIEIKKSIIKTTLKKDSSINLDEKDEMYINTRFDIVMESSEELNNDSDKEVGSIIANAVSEKKEDSLRAEDEKMTAWQKPLSMSKTVSIK